MKPLLLAVAVLLAPPSLPAQDDPLKAGIDGIVAEAMKKGRWMGLAIGVIQSGRPLVLGYGRVSAAGEDVPRGDTLFEIGSITKTFTAVLLSVMVAEGSVALDEPVRKLLPEGTVVPRTGEGEILLHHLASQTSGLPRMPDNFKPADPGDPYADYGTERLLTFLKRHELRRAPGAAYEYSNLGAGLLGHALAARAGRDFGTLVREKILDPLGMTDTVLAIDDARRPRLAPGHARGKAVKSWNFDAVAGAGALRSTAADMLRYLRAQLGEGPEALVAASARTHEPRAAVSGAVRIGLGWHLAPLPGGGPEAVWHNGGTGGYRSYAGFVKEKKAAVIVLSNSVNDGVDALGQAVLALLCR